MKLAYVIGPIRGSNPESIMERMVNLVEASKVAIELWEVGFGVFCPHLNTGFFSGIVPEQQFLDFDFKILKTCDFVVTFGDLRTSAGSLGEIMYCEREKIPIYNSVEQAVMNEGEGNAILLYKSRV